VREPEFLINEEIEMSLYSFVILDILCGLVVRVTGYRFRGPGFDFPALSDFVRSSGSGTGTAQPCEYN
jgi:hypothetical protein